MQSFFPSCDKRGKLGWGRGIGCIFLRKRTLFSCLYKFASYPGTYLYATVVAQVRSQFLPPSPAHTPPTPPTDTSKFSSRTCTSLCDNTHPLAAGGSGSRTWPCGWVGARCSQLRARRRPGPGPGPGPARGAPAHPRTHGAAPAPQSGTAPHRRGASCRPGDAERKNRIGEEPEHLEKLTDNPEAHPRASRESSV